MTINWCQTTVLRTIQWFSHNWRLFFHWPVHVRRSSKLDFLLDNSYYVTCHEICPRVKAVLTVANNLVLNSGDFIFRHAIFKTVFTLLLELGNCEILIAIVHSARGLNTDIFPALLLHIECVQFSGDYHLIFTGSKIDTVDQSHPPLLLQRSHVWKFRHCTWPQ